LNHGIQRDRGKRAFHGLLEPRREVLAFPRNSGMQGRVLVGGEEAFPPRVHVHPAEMLRYRRVRRIIPGGRAR
jgi:hypothetical protein